MGEISKTTIQPDTRHLEAQLEPELLPVHVGVIMDGNGRWGVAHGGTREYGHRESVDAMRSTVTAASDLGVRYLSLFCFSVENLQRPPAEVGSLFKLFNEVLDFEPTRLNEKNVRIVTSGMLNLLPDPLPEKFSNAIELTRNNTGLMLNLCVMYSGRMELLESMRALAQAARDGSFDLADLDEASFRQFLCRPEIPDLDLVIRTSGEMRISNFLLWQMAYSELYFCDVLWPDFSRPQFIEALLDYQRRQRRFGKV
jgi:undecaprenyl diphosphate synthase